MATNKQHSDGDNKFELQTNLLCALIGSGLKEKAGELLVDCSQQANDIEYLRELEAELINALTQAGELDRAAG